MKREFARMDQSKDDRAWGRHAPIAANSSFWIRDPCPFDAFGIQLRFASIVVQIIGASAQTSTTASAG